MVKIKIPELKCERCGKKWIPRKKDVRVCPECKSPYWDREIKIRRKNAAKNS